MIAIYVGTVFAALVAAWMALTVPAEEAFKAELAGEVAAVNFISYQYSVGQYLSANPSANGTIADASLTFQSGYIRNSNWTNVVSGGVLYVYSNTPPTKAMNVALSKILKNAGTSIGLKTAGGTMTTLDGRSTGITIPAAIPVGSVVFVGN